MLEMKKSLYNLKASEIVISDSAQELKILDIAVSCDFSTSKFNKILIVIRNFVPDMFRNEKSKQKLLHPKGYSFSFLTLKNSQRFLQWA